MELELLEPQKLKKTAGIGTAGTTEITKKLKWEPLEPQKLLESEPLESQLKKAGIAHA